MEKVVGRQEEALLGMSSVTSVCLALWSCPGKVR